MFHFLTFFSHMEHFHFQKVKSASKKISLQLENITTLQVKLKEGKLPIYKRRIESLTPGIHKPQPFWQSMKRGNQKFAVLSDRSDSKHFYKDTVDQNIMKKHPKVSLFSMSCSIVHSIGKPKMSYTIYVICYFCLMVTSLAGVTHSFISYAVLQAPLHTVLSRWTFMGKYSSSCAIVPISLH